MHFTNFEDIQIGKSITESSNQLIDSTVKRIDNDYVEVTITNKGDEVVLKYRKDLENETFDVSVKKNLFWYITLNGEKVDSIDEDQFKSVEIKQITPTQMALYLEG